MRNVLFIGNGHLGWQTMAQALQLFSSSRGDFVSHHTELGKNPFVKQLLAHSMIRKIAYSADIKFKRRHIGLEEAVAAAPYDHVHCFGHLVAVPQLFKKRGLSYSVTTDGTWLQNTKELHKPSSTIDRRRCRRRSKAEVQIFSDAEFISCTSRWAQQSLLHDLNIDPAKVSVEPFPILSENIVAQSSDASHITFIGNDFYRKGGDLLVEVHQQYFSEVAELHIVSSADPSDWIQGSSNIFWHSNVSNKDLLRNILPMSKVVVLPSRVDQSPLVLTEAAAAGIPVIATAVAGIPELVKDGKSGFVIPRGGKEALAEKLRDILENDEKAFAMSQAARAHYKEKLCSKVSSKRLFDHIANVVEAQPLKQPAAAASAIESRWSEKTMRRNLSKVGE